MTAKHTPAPWIAKGCLSEGYTIREQCSNVIIAETNNYLIQTAENANLIAAAPDLLDALIDLFAVTNVSNESIDALDKARTAITKATEGEKHD